MNKIFKRLNYYIDFICSVRARKIKSFIFIWEMVELTECF